MAKRTAELAFTGPTNPYTSSYDPTKITLGKWMNQTLGGTGTANYVGPYPISFARPMEASTSIQCFYPHAIDLGNGTHWVFLADAATAAATRRIVLYRYDTANQAWSWRGFITMTYPTATNHTIRGMRVVRHLYTTGTVAVTGTAVTGSGTAWQTNRYAVGSRIGFGSTDPNQISTWYYISAIGSDTSITLSSSIASNLAAGTSFVIEELRIYTATTNATATNGGLFVTKGVNFDDFIPTGTIVSAATTVDNQKAVYWLADASTVTNTASAGLGMSDQVSDTSHYIYVPNADTTTSLRIFKYDVRASLTALSAGKDTSAFLFKTGTQTTTGTISQTNSSRFTTLNHGPGAGSPALYLTTTTRVLRCPESAITSGAVSFVSDMMVEVPTGGTSTFSLSNSMTSVDSLGSIDRLFITNTARHYLTQYNSTSIPFDRVLFVDNRQQDQSSAESGLTPFPNILALSFSIWSEDGLLYLLRNGTSSASNILYVVPLSADWDFADTTGYGYIITPEIATTGAARFSKAATNHATLLGSDALGMQPEPFRCYFRTAGISDNSGSWTLMGEDGDLSSVAGADSIQFKYTFRIAGPFCIPARLYGVMVSYEDNTTDSHFQPSVALSSITSKQFAWRFSSAFGGTVPTIKVYLYDAVSGSLLVSDNTASPTGTFEKSTDGGSNWGAYNTTDKGNETTYIRYTPSSLGDNIKVRALLTQ